MVFYYDKQGRKYDGINRICAECGKEEIVRSSNPAKNCNDCSLKKRSSLIDADWELADYIDKSGAKYKGRVRTCTACGEKKVVRITTKSDLCKKCRASNRKSTPKVFVNSGKVKRTAIKVTCRVCKNDSLIRKDSHRDTGMCRSCRSSEWGKINGKIQGPKRFKTGIKVYRKHALEHFKEVCLCCRVKNDEKEIIIHHVDENRKNNCISNLIPLCKSCHKFLHNRLNKGMEHEKAFKEVKELKCKPALH